MSVTNPHSDNELLDLLRICGGLCIKDISQALQVTATAVRQRLARLLEKGLISRNNLKKGLGRPLHMYFLSEKEAGNEPRSQFYQEALSLAIEELDNMRSPLSYAGPLIIQILAKRQK